MPAPSPTDLLCRSLAQAQERYQLFPPTQPGTPLPVIVGVSGGADSVCLLHVLARFVQPWYLDLHVAHLDHNVRPDSAEDAAFVRTLAEEMALPFHTRCLAQSEIDAADKNLEAALRRLRYGFLSTLAAELAPAGSTCPIVAVAHNADDQAETILMHILRGSGLAGLAGMRPVTFLSSDADSEQPLRLVRPLLNVQRTDILQYLNAHNLTWREDPSNQNLTFSRNRLRHTLLPQLKEYYPNLTDTLSRLGALLAAEDDRAERLNDEAFQMLLQTVAPEKLEPPVRAVLDRVAFRDLDLATQRGVLRRAAVHVSLPLEEMTYERTETLRVAVIGDGIVGPTPLASVFAWSVETGRFSLHQRSALAFSPDHPFLDLYWRSVFGANGLPVGNELAVGEWQLSCREMERSDLPPNWADNQDPWQAYCDARRVGELLLTTPRRGQQFAPLGMEGRHKHLGDFFTDEKTPVALRTGWPLLVDGAKGEVLWVCGLRLAHRARIRPDTQHILHLKWSKE